MPRCKNPNCKEKFNAKVFLQKYCLEKDECIRLGIEEKKAKAWKNQKIVMKEKLKTLSEWKTDLQTEINHIVRLIDKDQPCIATGATTGKMNAGHYISRGSNDTIRFHLDNIHIQSEHSNSFNSGDTLRYQDGIIKIYGQKYLDSMNALKSMPVIKLNVEEIRARISVARSIVKELKKLNLVYSTENRLILRKKFNQMIGIYP